MLPHTLASVIRTQILSRWLKPKVVIYTAITNDYDDLKVPAVINPNFTYIAFVDSKTYPIPAPWQRRMITVTERNPRVTSRYYKILPHLCLPEFDYSIWVDATMFIKSDFAEVLEAAFHEHHLAFFPHPLRTCLYEEARLIAHFKGDFPEMVERQVALYRQAGYPEDNGLISGRFIIRKHHNPLVKQTMNDWWQQIKHYSHRDQVSANYVIWRNQIPYYKLQGDVLSTKYFEVLPHKKNETYVI